MEENSSKSEKNLALDKKRAEEIREEINIAILNGKETVVIGDGKSFININIKKSSKKQESYDVRFGGKKIATVKKGEKIPSDKIIEAISRYQERFDFDKMNKELGRTPTEAERAEQKSLELEKELNQAKKQGHAQKLRDGREMTKRRRFKFNDA